MSNALFALIAFVKLPKNLTFNHRLSKVELKVAKVRAIGKQIGRLLYKKRLKQN
jgi:hypothetical protein